MEELFFENENVKIYYMKKEKCGMARWYGFASGANYREGLNKAIELYQSKNTGKWIGNLQNMEAITFEDQEWTNNDWFPRAVASGLKKLGVIVGKDIFNQMSVD
jgi:hypothetical protein